LCWRVASFDPKFQRALSPLDLGRSRYCCSGWSHWQPTLPPFLLFLYPIPFFLLETQFVLDRLAWGEGSYFEGSNDRSRATTVIHSRDVSCPYSSPYLRLNIKSADQIYWRYPDW
jgi:hypothetical protein